MHNSALKSADSAKISDLLMFKSMIVICMKKKTRKKTTHRVLIKEMVLLKVGKFSLVRVFCKICEIMSNHEGLSSIFMI